MLMKMPAKIKAKWLKALRSGEYKQAKGTMYNPKTCGFCCLGVLEHVVSGGKVEDDPESESGFRCEPSMSWYKDNGIKVRDDNSSYEPGYSDDPTIQELMDMNDGKYDWNNSKRIRSKPFSVIANWIEKNIETY
jgi:hypothetical protein